jgi:hypothetical protein
MGEGVWEYAAEPEGAVYGVGVADRHIPRKVPRARGGYTCSGLSRRPVEARRVNEALVRHQRLRGCSEAGDWLWCKSNAGAPQRALQRTDGGSCAGYRLQRAALRNCLGGVWPSI